MTVAPTPRPRAAPGEALGGTLSLGIVIARAITSRMMPGRRRECAEAAGGESGGGGGDVG